MKQMLKMLEKASEDNRWFQKNYERLRSKFKNEFVAIKNKKIILHGKDLDKIIKQLEDMGEDPGLILIEFVTEEGVEIIL